MLRSRLPENPIYDYPFIQQFLARMHSRVCQDADVQYDGKEDINEVILIAQILDAMDESTGAYRKNN